MRCCRGRCRDLGADRGTALSRAGKTVTLYEARNRVGGRVLTRTHTAGAVDLGATWFWPNEPSVARLVRELGIDVFPQSIEGDALFERDTTGPLRLDGNAIDAPAGRFSSGAQALAAGLADRLPPGALRLNDPVGAIEVLNDGVRVTAGSGQTQAEAAVIALPPALAVEAVDFMPPLPAETARIAAETAVWMGSTVKAVAVFDEPFWRREQLFGSAISYAGPFREFHDLSGPGGSIGALFAFASADAFLGFGRHGIEAGFREQLVRLFGEKARNTQAVFLLDWSQEEYTTPRDPHGQASIGHFGHDHYQEGSHGGRLQCASTETSAAYAGHIEGAIRAGTRAAKNILTMSAVKWLP